MKYAIFSDGELINTIVADEDFCKEYCDINGYTYEPIQEQTQPSDPKPTTEEILNTLLGVTE